MKIEQNHIFDISFKKCKGSGPKNLNFLGDRSPTSNYNSSDWNFLLDSDTYNTYNYIDSYRFGTGIGKKAGTINLANYNIDLKLVDPNYKALSKMWMQVGDQSMEGKPSKGGRAFRFNLGAKDEVADYLGSKKYYGGNTSTRSFTFFEYPKKPTNKNYFGKNNIVVTVGPDAYTTDSKEKIIKSSNLTDWENLQFNKLNVKGQLYNVKVGAFADQLLQQANQKAINFQFDKAIDAKEIKTTQSIIFQPVNSKPMEDWERFIIDWSQPIRVSGSSKQPEQALINGKNQRENQAPYSGKNEQFGKFFNSMLEISSTYNSQKNSKYGTKPSTAIEGMTFLDPPSRGEGTVQVNSPYVSHIRRDDWWDKNYSKSQDISSGSEIYLQRLIRAIESFRDNPNIKITPPQVRSQLFDNQIIGGWAAQSDGIEDGTSNLTSGRNFYHVNDDSIKLLNSNQTFIQNTIHQGQAGSPLSFAYGASGSDVNNVKADGLYIHRITQPNGINGDPMGGLILDYWGFNDIDYGPTEFNGIYIPSMNNGQHDANALNSMGKITAVDPNDFIPLGRNFGQVSMGGTYRAGGYTITNSKSYVPIKHGLQSYVLEQPGSDPALKSIQDNTQDSIIDTANFNGDDGGMVTVNVYGASENNIYAQPTG